MNLLIFQRVSSLKNRLFKKGTFANSLAITTSGAGMGVLISYLLMPIVTRLYTTSDYGLFALFLSISNIGKIISGANYPASLVIPRSHRLFLSTVKLCFTLIGFYFLINLIVFLVGGEKLRLLIGAEKLGNLIFLIPLAIALLSSIDVMVNLNIRFKSFKNNALGNLSSKGANQGVSILYGSMFGSHPMGLICGQLAGSTFYLFFLVKDGVLKRFEALKDITLKEIKIAAIALKKYPIFVFPSNFILQLSSDIPIYILTLFFGTKATGSFAFASMILQAPYAILGNSMAPVFLQRANELFYTDLKKLQDFVSKMYFRLLFLGVIPFSIITIFGDVIFSFVFGEPWRQAGTFAGYMSLFYLFRLMSTPLKTIFRVTKKEQFILYINFSTAFLRIASLVFGVYFFGLEQSIIIFSIVSLICYYASFIVIFKTMELKVLRKSFISFGVISISLAVLILIRYLTIGL